MSTEKRMEEMTSREGRTLRRTIKTRMKNHGANDADQHVKLVQVFLNLIALIMDRSEDQIGGQLLFDNLQARLHLTSHLQSAASFFLHHGQADGGLTIDPVDIEDLPK